MENQRRFLLSGSYPGTLLYDRSVEGWFDRTGLLKNVLWIEQLYFIYLKAVLISRRSTTRFPFRPHSNTLGFLHVLGWPPSKFDSSCPCTKSIQARILVLL